MEQQILDLEINLPRSQSKLFVQNGHLAMTTDGSTRLLTSAEVFEIIFKDDIKASSNNNLRFSKIPARLKCVFSNSKNGQIECSFLGCYKGTEIKLAQIDGRIIDQFVENKIWRYVSFASIVQEILDRAKIKNHTIDLKQYLQIYFELRNIQGVDVVDTVDINTVKENFFTNKFMPYGLKANLYKYQKDGFSWIYQMLNVVGGCILGDEMGLGKTLQIIAVIEKYREEKRGPSLVVAPLTLLENWKSECAKFAPSLKVYVHSGQDRTGSPIFLQNFDLVVTSYETAVSDFFILSQIQWSMMAVDEAQYIKNPMAERTIELKKLNRDGTVAITGTPFENHITDLWSIVNAVCPWLLGSLDDFISVFQDNPNGGAAIKPMLSAVMLRRLSADEIDLPSKVITDEKLSMCETERLQYLTLTKTFSTNPIESFTALRMFCCHPFLTGKETNNDPINCSNKYQRLCEILLEIMANDEKTIVFSSFKEMLDLMVNDLTVRLKTRVQKIDGSTPPYYRKNIVDGFNKSCENKILVLNPKAAGAGLNITGANHVIFYNLEWNPSLEDQCIGRAYRIHQQKKVIVHRLFYENSIESLINEKIYSKRETFSSAIAKTDSGKSITDALKFLGLINGGN